MIETEVVDVAMASKPISAASLIPSSIAGILAERLGAFELVRRVIGSIEDARWVSGKYHGADID